MIIPIHNPGTSRLRVLAVCSKAGQAVWSAIDLQKEMEATPDGCPFEIVGLFSDNPDSPALKEAAAKSLPAFVLDAAKYHHGADGAQMSLEASVAFEKAMIELLAPAKADLLLVDGYRWSIQSLLLKEYKAVRIWPGGQLCLTGVLQKRQTQLRAKATYLTAPAGQGSVLVMSEAVDIDYGKFSDENSGVELYLPQVMEQSARAGARAVLELASGHFGFDEKGQLCYKGQVAPAGLEVDSWNENKPRHQRQTEKLLYPKSVAVIGASNKPGIGKAVTANILRDKFQGQVYAVNVRGEDVMEAKGYTSVLEIPGELDLAVIATPPGAVHQVAEECGKKGVGAVICVTAGFKEVGGEGTVAQEKLMAIVNKYNMRMIGPNCMGAMTVKSSLNATILANSVVPGNVALVTQSGSIGASMLDYAGDLGIGFSAIISLGNQADVTVCDLLPFFEEDEHTNVIVLYLEMILEPQRFCRLAASMSKPILVLKSGRTAEGMAAVSSHTGSLAGDDKMVEAMLEKAGVTRVETMLDLFICASALSMMPQVEGNRVGLLTNAGGPGILISDALIDRGFSIPPLSENLKNSLKGRLFKEASIANPIDVVATAPPEHFALAARAMIDSGEFDSLLICCIPPATVNTADVATALVAEMKDVKIPVLANFVGPTLGGEASRIMRANGVPASEYPEQMAIMLEHMRKKKRLQTVQAFRPDSASIARGRSLLNAAASGEYLQAADAYALLDIFGIRAARNVIVKNAAEVSALTLSFPVVAKIEHPAIIHKSDVGGVRLNIASSAELEKVVTEFLEKFAGAEGVLVQEQIPSGLELIIGSVSDPQLGSGVMVGLGGVWVEIMKDVAFGYPPLGHEEAVNLINKLKCVPLIDGYRGKPGVNKDALAALLERVSAMLLALPDIVELDLNPVIYDPAKDDFVAADVRIKRG